MGGINFWTARLEYKWNIAWNISGIFYSMHIPWNISGIFQELVTWWNISGIFQFPIWKRYVWGGVRTGPATYHCEGGGQVTVVVLYVWCRAVPLQPWRVQHPWGQGVIQRRNLKAVDFFWNISGIFQENTTPGIVVFWLHSVKGTELPS